jgi:hypothetical protein
MKKYIIPLIICLISCHGNHQASSSASKTSSAEKPKVLSVNYKCALIYSPDSLKILELKKDGEENFYTAADDAMYYIAQSREFLQKNSIKVIETQVRSVDFYNGTKLVKHIDLNSVDNAWGIILFNGIDEPVESDMTSIELEFGQVMNK